MHGYTFHTQQGHLDYCNCDRCTTRMDDDSPHVMHLDDVRDMVTRAVLNRLEGAVRTNLQDMAPPSSFVANKRIMSAQHFLPARRAAPFNYVTGSGGRTVRLDLTDEEAAAEADRFRRRQDQAEEMLRDNMRQNAGLHTHSDDDVDAMTPLSSFHRNTRINAGGSR